MTSVFPTLRRIWLEALLVGVSGLGLVTGTLTQSPVQAIGATTGPIWSPHRAAQDLVDHTRAYGLVSGGLPADFYPIQQFFLDRNLPLALIYWHYRGSVSMERLTGTASRSGSPIDQAALEAGIQRVGPRLLPQPGDFIYVPLQPDDPGGNLQQWPSGSRFRQFLIVLHPYPPRWSDPREEQDVPGYEAEGILLRGVGPYLVLAPAQPLERSRIVAAHIDAGTGQVVLRQMGTHMEIGVSGNSIVPTVPVE